jgi:hypothetical protein
MIKLILQKPRHNCPSRARRQRPRSAAVPFVSSGDHDAPASAAVPLLPATSHSATLPAASRIGKTSISGERCERRERPCAMRSMPGRTSMPEGPREHGRHNPTGVGFASKRRSRSPTQWGLLQLPPPASDSPTQLRAPRHTGADFEPATPGIGTAGGELSDPGATPVAATGSWCQVRTVSLAPDHRQAARYKARYHRPDRP